MVELVGGENVDHAVAVGIGLHPVVEIESRLAEEFFSALLLNGEKSALNGTDAGSGDVSVLSLEFFGVLADVLQHGLDVFEVEEEQTVVVSNFEDEGEDTFLNVVEI